MSDRIQTIITADLPEKNKYTVIADVEAQAHTLATKLSEAHGITFTAVTKPVRPGKKAAAVLSGPDAVAAVVAMDPVTESVVTPAHPRRHAAG